MRKMQEEKRFCSNPGCWRTSPGMGENSMLGELFSARVALLASA
jgi:hypothetical protein